MNEPSITKSRVLDVAEELFAEEGLDRVTVRDITEKAKVNVAAINYHFGGKQELIAAVFERRVAPVNAARLAALDALEKSCGEKPPQIEQVLEAFIRPALACCQGTEHSTAFSKLFGRCLAETRPEIETLLKKQFEPIVDRMNAMLLKALPHLSRAELFWRMKFTFGALHHWLLTKDKYVPEWAQGTSVEGQVQRLISFAAAGFRAP